MRRIMFKAKSKSGVTLTPPFRRGQGLFEMFRPLPAFPAGTINTFPPRQRGSSRQPEAGLAQNEKAGCFVSQGGQRGDIKGDTNLTQRIETKGKTTESCPPREKKMEQSENLKLISGETGRVTWF